MKMITQTWPVLRTVARSLPAFLSIWAPIALAAGGDVAPTIVVQNCSGCHGLSGIAQVPYFPNLAGLDSDYLGKRLESLHAAPAPPVDEFFYRILTPHRAKKLSKATNVRTNMVGMAHNVEPDQLHLAAGWYATQPAHTAAAAMASDPAIGQRLFALGSPGEHVPACKTCHGEAGEGKRLVAPRLAGQNSGYLTTRLAEFRSDDTEKASAMNAIAKHLTTEESRLIASFLAGK